MSAGTELTLAEKMTLPEFHRRAVLGARANYKRIRLLNSKAHTNANWPSFDSLSPENQASWINEASAIMSAAFPELSPV